MLSLNSFQRSRLLAIVTTGELLEAGYFSTLQPGADQEISLARLKSTHLKSYR